jgi:hypothetical protein
MKRTIEIYVSLLEEGTPTLRGTKAIDLGNNLYELLPTSNYDPEDEVWEFEPGSIVFGQARQSNKGEKILVAVRQNISREEILRVHPGAILVPIYVLTGKQKKAKTEAINLGNQLYKLLPTKEYDPASSVWEYSPGSIVRALEEIEKTGHKILVAFDQIREDRTQEHYAKHVTTKKK